MTPDQKPEWFQIAEADNAGSAHKISKGLPLMAIALVAAVIGAGVIFGQTQEESPANATETVAPTVNGSTQTSVYTKPVAPDNNGGQVLTSADKENVAPVADPVATKTPVAPVADPVATKTPVAPGVANPLGKKPNNGEHEGRESGDHEGHEGGDHEGGQEDD